MMRHRHRRPRRKADHREAATARVAAVFQIAEGPFEREIEDGLEEAAFAGGALVLIAGLVAMVMKAMGYGQP
mgnify:CR=1 FL=1